MSKPMKVRFTYGDAENQEFKSVGSVHKGPINLSNLYDTFTNPTYDQISFQEAPQNVQIVQSQAEVVNVPLSQAITRGYDEAQNPSINVQGGTQPIDTAAYNIQSERQMIKQYQISSQQHLAEKRQSGKREAIFKKQQPQQQTQKPELKVEELKESEFRKEIIEPANQKKQSLRLTQKEQSKTDNPDQIVLKAPSFKYNPESEDDRGVMKRQFVRGQKKNQKYLYSGIPEKKEDDFIGCFGCCAPKPKTYTISNQNERQ